MAGARGEGYLDVDGEQVVVLFTNRALADGERATGKSILQILRGAQNQELGIGDVAQLLLVGMEAARREARSASRAYAIADAYRVMDAVGFTEVASVVFNAIAAVVAYDGTGGMRPNPPVE